MSRPQVGIDRIVSSPRTGNEPRESMNCKSCRKRKIKCNRLRPTCEQCRIFQCACLYDAVPKKRGPKTDVLEALLKRVDGLEKRLKDEKRPKSSVDEDAGMENEDEVIPEGPQFATRTEHLGTITCPPDAEVESSPPSSVPLDMLVDTYFMRCHDRPYYILEETTTRQRVLANQIPPYLLNAICAVAARYATHPSGYHSAVRLSEEFAIRARIDLDSDEPSIDCLQALLLLVTAFTAAGKGKKAYMLLVSAIGMAMAVSLHRESDSQYGSLTPIERQTYRRLFWTCYLLDRFSACGSKRPSLISDKSILLRLPSWSPSPTVASIEGEYFQSTSNLQYGKKIQGSSGMLIDITRILGFTNRYLAAGGVKGDSHFPWHSLSNLSKVRNDLDVWASGTQEVFSSVEALFGQIDSTTLLLSKLIYHLIHCLIYRPFLPINLSELAGTGQHQSWQIEATNLCFLHANAIAELVKLGKQSPSVEYPAFVGYCISTAGTVHVHGAHYNSVSSPFSNAADFLSREMQQLSDLRYAWSTVQYQRETLQSIYNCHSELVKSLANNPMRYSPIFHLEDFFDRYGELGVVFDGAHVSFEDINSDAQEEFTGHDLYAPQSVNNLGRGKRKRSDTTNSRKGKQLELKDQHPLGHLETSLISPNPTYLSTSTAHAVTSQQQNTIMDHLPMQTPPLSAFGTSNQAQTQIPLPFSPPYHFSNEGYDPMFGIGMGTPGGESVGTHESEKDPFLSLLEQLAENEGRGGGAGELDFYLGSTSG